MVDANTTTKSDTSVSKTKLSKRAIEETKVSTSARVAEIQEELKGLMGANERKALLKELASETGITLDSTKSLDENLKEHTKGITSEMPPKMKISTGVSKTGVKE